MKRRLNPETTTPKEKLYHDNFQVYNRLVYNRIKTNNQEELIRKQNESDATS
jgi:hypothetical protein